MPDMLAQGAALAARYDVSQMTAPTGYDAVRLSTHLLPNIMPPLPCVLVFPDKGSFVTGSGMRQGGHDWIVRFYYDQTGDYPRASAGLLAWLSVLADQHRLAAQLGGTVTIVRTMGWRIGSMSYAGEDYFGIELSVHVVTDEGWAAAA